MQQRRYISILLVFVIVFASCGGNLVGLPKAARGNAQFSNYIAVGSTETSGFADGALYLSAQQHSYPALLGQQFAATSFVNFNQPIVGNNNGAAFYNDTLVQRLILGYYNYPPCNSAFASILVKQPHYFDPMFIPIRKTGRGDLSGLPEPGPPYNNLGVPNLHVKDILDPNLSVENFFYFRMYGNPAPSLLTQIKNNPATFFTVWLGTQEILDYALAGGQNVSIPSVQNFQSGLDSVLDALTYFDTSAGGVIANIPDITDFPFFNTITYNYLTLDSSLSNLLNALYASSGIHFQPGNNPFVISDPTAPNGYRQIQSGEKIFLSTPLDTLKCALQGSAVPLKAQYYLNAQQVQTIKQAIQNYNLVIASEAATRKIPLADLYSLYKSLKSGIQYNGQTFSNVLVTGYFFSLDGLNPSFQGHAIIANEFIKQINKNYKSTVPILDPTSFNGPSFP